MLIVRLVKSRPNRINLDIFRCSSRHYYTYNDFIQGLFHTCTLKFRNKVLRTNRFITFVTKVCCLSVFTFWGRGICLVDLFIRRCLVCPIAGFAVHIANILLHFLSQVFRLT